MAAATIIFFERKVKESLKKSNSKVKVKVKKVNQVIMLGRFYKVRPGLHLLTNENLTGTGYKPITGQNDRREEVKS